MNIPIEQKKREQNALYQRRYRKKLIKQGKCIECKKPWKGKSYTCTECVNKKYMKIINRWKKKKLCVRCGKPLSPEEQNQKRHARGICRPIHSSQGIN